MTIRVEEEGGRSVQDGELASEPGFWCFLVRTPYLLLKFDKRTGRELIPAANSSWKICADDLRTLQEREQQFENERDLNYGRAVVSAVRSARDPATYPTISLRHRFRND